MDKKNFNGIVISLAYRFCTIGSYSSKNSKIINLAH